MPEATSLTFPYAASSVHVLAPRDVAAIRRATADGIAVYRAMVPLLQSLDDEALTQLGIPANARDLVRLRRAWNTGSVIGRFDLLAGDDGWRIIEYNAETPFLVVEAFAANAEVLAAHPEYADPNAGARAQLRDAVRAAFAGIDGRIAVIATNVYREDWFTAEFFAGEVRVATGNAVDAVPLHELRVDAAGLRDARGAIAGVYRLYPLELLARDRGAGALFAAVASDRVRLVNPPAALLQQSKMTQVLVWNLAERGAFFDAETRAAVRRSFLPTFAEGGRDGRWVAKPVFGREGASVHIDGLEPAAPRPFYDDQDRVFQRFVETQPVAFRDGAGNARTGYPVMSCFAVGGEPSAIVARIGGPITDVDAFFLPVATTR